MYGEKLSGFSVFCQNYIPDSVEKALKELFVLMKGDRN